MRNAGKKEAWNEKNVFSFPKSKALSWFPIFLSSLFVDRCSRFIVAGIPRRANEYRETAEELRTKRFPLTIGLPHVVTPCGFAVRKVGRVENPAKVAAYAGKSR